MLLARLQHVGYVQLGRQEGAAWVTSVDGPITAARHTELATRLLKLLLDELAI